MVVWEGEVYKVEYKAHFFEVDAFVIEVLFDSLFLKAEAFAFKSGDPSWP